MEIIMRGREIPPHLLRYFEPVQETAQPSVWSLASEAYSGAHFATFPTALAARCIQAGTSQGGVCAACKTPYQRQVEYDRQATRPGTPIKADSSRNDGGRAARVCIVASRDFGFAPGCSCQPAVSVPATVLDPFSGASTTCLVARQLGRHGVGIDLSLEYLGLSRDRLGLTALHEWQHGGSARPVTYDDLPLFTTEAHV